MNAEPLLKPLINAARRGVIVTCYLCLGYNDAGELLPFQNGTNEMIANRLYNALESEEEKACLRIFYYAGKDQTRPIHNSFKKRSCHIKLMIVDEQIAIQGMWILLLGLDFGFVMMLTFCREWKSRYAVFLPQSGNQCPY
jgi:hypothetical protein